MTTPEARRWRYLEKKYGITKGRYNVLLKQQHGRCAICHRPPKKRRLSVDHDHKTGRIRGLLCYKCNYGLGFFGYNPETLVSLTIYLEPYFNVVNR